jgi:hypothetical protein
MVNTCVKCASRLLSGLILVLLLTTAVARADDVFLKNGQRLISPRAWVAGEYAHFILQGTADVEIRYALEIIDRILTSEGKQIYPPEMPQVEASPNSAVTEPVSASPEQSVPSVKQQTPNTNPSAAASTTPAAKLPEEAVQAGPGVDTTLLRAKAKKLRNVPFYDPRRQEKYWATANSRHPDVNGAVNALAEQFSRTPQWVTAHMGATNDLGEIHLNLIRQLENWRRPQAEMAETPTAGEVNAPKQEKATPQKKPKPSPETPPPHRKAVRATNPFASNLPDTQGPYFYSPRRPKKFWANETSRHDSLDAALKALADQYSRSVEWVEAHMGESNSLEEIHRNLTQAAAQDAGQENQ